MTDNRPARGQDLVAELCSIFGLDPGRVLSLSIEASWNDIVTIEVEQHVDELQADELATRFRSYRLEPLEPGDE